MAYPWQFLTILSNLNLFLLVFVHVVYSFFSIILASTGPTYLRVELCYWFIASFFCQLTHWTFHSISYLLRDTTGCLNIQEDWKNSGYKFLLLEICESMDKSHWNLANSCQTFIIIYKKSFIGRNKLDYLFQMFFQILACQEHKRDEF